MKTVALRSLGCKVNAYETEGMQQILQQKGYSIVPFDKKADIYIVNTCSVTNIADQKSRQMLHRAKKTNPEGIVVACGCYVQTGKERLEIDPAVDIIVGNNEKKNIAEILEDYYASLEENASCNTFSVVPNMDEESDYEEMRVDVPSEHTRSFVKIQDGCNRFCTYCVIPYARGRIRSRLIEDVVGEVTALAANGCKEIVITGIHISSYGLDRGECELLDLLKRLNLIEGIERIRLGSLEPGIITEEFAKGIRGLEKVCPHFHLSMQSGTDSVLKRMNRHYTAAEFYEKTQILRAVYDSPAITTDVIVGFPGETQEEFEQTLEFVKKIDFYELHVFKYSRRDGTVAARMPDQIPEKDKNSRSEALIALGNEMSLAYRQKKIGKSVSVLIEEIKEINGKKYWIGHTPEYIKAAVEYEKGTDLENKLIFGVLGDFISPEVLQCIGGKINE